MNMNVLLISEDYLKTNSNLNDNAFGKWILPAIRESQEMGLMPIIGECLYKRICEMVDNGDINKQVNVAYKDLLDERIQPYLLYQTLCNIVPIINGKMANIGTVATNDEHIITLSQGELDLTQNYYRERADFYAKRLQEWVKTNETAYPELKNCGCGNMQPNLDSSANSVGIWLGGTRGRVYKKGGCSCKEDNPDYRPECPDYEEGYNSGYTSGYTSGMTDGYGRGYGDGESEGYASGYTSGYTDGQAECPDCPACDCTSAYTSGVTDGYSSGYTSGRTDGFEDGFDDGYQSGYTSGYTEGRSECPDYEEAFSSGFTEGYSSGYTVAIGDIEGQFTALTATTNGVYLPESEFAVFSSVTVNVPTGSSCNLQEKTFALTPWDPELDPEEHQYYNINTEWSVRPDAKKQGISALTIDGSSYYDAWVECLDAEVATAFQEGYTSGYTDGGGSLPPMEEKSVTLTGASEYITPSFGYMGMSGVSVDAQTLCDGYFGSGYTSGVTDGYASGFTSGYTSGYSSGYTSGSTDGYDSGFTSGYSSGASDGYTQAIGDLSGQFTALTATTNGVYLPASEFAVFSSVTVNVDNQVTLSGWSVLTYTTTDGQPITPTNPDAFGDESGNTLPIVSNTYQNGIGKMVFSGVIYSIGIPEETWAFENCTTLKSLTLPSQLKYIGYEALVGCSALTSLVLPDGCDLRPGGASGNLGRTGIRMLVLPDSVTVIPEDCFENCENLQTVMIGSGCSRINLGAFSIDVNSGYTGHLERIYCYAPTAPTLETNVFRDQATNGILYVPSGATGYNAWLSALPSGWTISATL